MCFYFFSNQANVSRQKCPRHSELFVIRTGDQVHLNEIGEIHERSPGRTVFKIVQGEKVAFRFQTTAGGDDLTVDFDRFQDLDDYLIFRKDCGEFAEQRFARAVDKRAAAGNQTVDSEQQNAAES